jgi:hypothetical protein
MLNISRGRPLMRLDRPSVRELAEQRLTVVQERDLHRGQQRAKAAAPDQRVQQVAPHRRRPAPEERYQFQRVAQRRHAAVIHNGVHNIQAGRKLP